MDNKCPFCKAESEREIIASTSLSIAFFDGFPVSPGHALIIPRRHVASLALTLVRLLAKVYFMSTCI